jgi:26S proteasome regulatory subunit N9
MSGNAEGLEFMESVVDKVNTPATQDAYAYAVVETASIKVGLQKYDEVRKDLDAAGKIIDNFDTIENLIHAAYYRVNAQYYSVMAANEEALTFKYKSDYQNYYRNALLYLACLPEPSPLSKQEAQTRAYELSIAALLSDKTYNFGELLLHPILNELQHTEYDWLQDLLFAMNAGDLDAFHKLAPRIPSIVPSMLFGSFSRARAS